MDELVDRLVADASAVRHRASASSAFLSRKVRRQGSDFRSTDSGAELDEVAADCWPGRGMGVDEHLWRGQWPRQRSSDAGVPRLLARELARRGVLTRAVVRPAPLGSSREAAMTYPISEIDGIEPEYRRAAEVGRHPHHHRLLDAAKRPEDSGAWPTRPASTSASWAGPTPPTGCGSRASARTMPGCCRPPASIPSRSSSTATRPSSPRPWREANTKRKLVRVLPSEPRRRALDRAGQAAAAQDHLLIGRARCPPLTRSPRLTRSARPRKATARKH